MIKAALNGARAPGEHPALPLTPEQLAAGAETLEPAAVDAACPGVPLGLSTGAWIEADPAVHARLAAAWRGPDFASVDLTEAGHREVMAALAGAGIGIERASGSSRASRRSRPAASPSASCGCSSSRRTRIARRRWPGRWPSTTPRTTPRSCGPQSRWASP